MISGEIGEHLILEIDAQIATLVTEAEGTKLRTPTEVLKSVGKAKASNGPTTDLDRSCAICLNMIEPDCETCKCRCGTTFHNDCADNTDRCPVCIAVLNNSEENNNTE